MSLEQGGDVHIWNPNGSIAYDNSSNELKRRNNEEADSDFVCSYTSYRAGIFASTSPEQGAEAEVTRWWIEELETRSPVPVTVDIYWASSLAGHREMIEATQSGMADIGVSSCGIHTQVFPMMGTLGQIQLFNNKPVSRIMTDQWMYNEVPEAVAEFENNNLTALFLYSLANYHILSVVPARNLAEMKGLKVRVQGPENSTIIKAIGGVPVDMQVPEIYDGMLKRITDGTLCDADLATRFKLEEVGKYFIRIGVGSNPVMTAFMNLDTWGSLPPEVQQVLVELRAEFPVRYCEAISRDMKEITFQIFEGAGVEIIDLPAEDMETIKNHPDIVAIEDNWAANVAQNKTGVSVDRLEEIRQLFLQKLEENNTLYPDTFEP
ncbi:MAG: TRAP transporter substrate-binding protein DctP [Dehalococcoidia bacterium]